MKDYLTLNELIRDAKMKNYVSDLSDSLLTYMVNKLLNDKKYCNMIYNSIETSIKQDSDTAYLSINITEMMRDLKKVNKLSYISIKQLKRIIIDIINEHNLNEEHYIEYKFMKTVSGKPWLDLYINL